MFSDPAIIPLPKPLRVLLAMVIACVRTPKAKKLYERIGGKSPLIENTIKQAKALELVLGEETRCFVGFSYERPFIKEAVHRVANWGADRIVVLPLYPQYSTTTTESAKKAVVEALGKEGLLKKAAFVDRFFKHEGFLAAQTEQINNALVQGAFPENTLIVFSAHGLPESVVKSGDLYPIECEETARLLGSRQKREAILCYQSRLGPVKWIGPSTEETVKKAAEQNRSVLIVPISFVCEHVETLVELDQEVRRLAETGGSPTFGVVKTVGCHPLFINGLADLIQTTTEKIRKNEGKSH